MDRYTWQFINSFAAWFSACGTIAAVIVALYFARQDKRVRLRVNAGYRVIVSQGRKGPFPGYVSVGITNIGHREAQIVGIGWRTGVFKRQYADQTPNCNDGISSPIPIRLRDGEEAKYYFPASDDSEWLKEFTSNMFAPRVAWNIRFARIRVYTSVGKVFSARLERGLRRKLLEYSEKHGSAR